RILLASLALAGCIKVSPGQATPTAPVFVTSTLPPTQPGLALPTDTPATGTPDAATTTPGTPAGSSTSTFLDSSSTGSCEDSALMIADVTVPDDTQMSRGQTFTKTWRFLNNGTCPWSG